ncbi:MAG: hypothetical protein M4579_001424 [Chaenotheca gracillima]|nr:MAG: hypothetical protein M4579_001424 [Chaenotheca gracillima]
MIASYALAARAMLPTPDTSHVSFDNVYEPAEDSYLFLDTLSSATESAFLKDRFSPVRNITQSLEGIDSSPENTGHGETPALLACEIGAGSGVVLAFLTRHADVILGRSDVMTLGTDVNENACRATQRTVPLAMSNNASECSSSNSRNSRPCFLGAIKADLAGPLRSQSLDILIFNPPYVPTDSVPAVPVHASYNKGGTGDRYTDSFKLESDLLALSYAGGAHGMEVTDRLLDLIPELLDDERGVAYVLLCAQNNPMEVKSRIRAWSGRWNAETVGLSGKTGGWEKLQIIRIWQVLAE